jgi:hypothetical protein
MTGDSAPGWKNTTDILRSTIRRKMRDRAGL